MQRTFISNDQIQEDDIQMTGPKKGKRNIG